MQRLKKQIARHRLGYLHLDSNLLVVYGYSDSHLPITKSLRQPSVNRVRFIHIMDLKSNSSKVTAPMFHKEIEPRALDSE